jgi:hypothetical protein
LWLSDTLLREAPLTTAQEFEIFPPNGSWNQTREINKQRLKKTKQIKTGMALQ